MRISVVGQTFTDAEGRALVVAEYRPGAPDGREVVGTVAREGQAPRPYACNAHTFNEIWYERKPVVSPEEQERNRKHS